MKYNNAWIVFYQRDDGDGLDVRMFKEKDRLAKDHLAIEICVPDDIYYDFSSFVQLNTFFMQGSDRELE